MMDSGQSLPNRSTLPLAIMAIIVWVAIGYAVSEGMGDSLLVGGALALGAVLLAFVSPASGIAAVLLAAPTMYDLYPMPAGSFSLLELAILTSVAGIGARLLLDGLGTGFGSLLDLLTPAQVVVPVALLVVATAVAMVTLADPGYRSESLREVRTVIIEPLLFLAVARMVLRNHESRRIVGAMLVVGGTVLSLYAGAQIALDLGGVQAGDVTRATGTYTHPNNLALFLERTVLFTLGIAVVRPRWWPVWLLAAVQLAGLALTFSRGALLAVAVGLGLLLLLRGLYKWLLLLIAGGIGVAGFGLVLFPERLIDAGGSGAEPTRFTIWRASVRMLLDNPIFGVGPDQFLYQYSRRYIEPMGWPERYTSHPHNLVLDAWLRLGVLGVAALASLVAGVAWWIGKHLRAIRADTLAMGALAALVGGVAHGMVDNGFFLPDLATLTWFFIAVLVTVPVARSADVAADDTAVDRPGMEATWPAPADVDVAQAEPINQARWRSLAIGAMAFLFVFGPLATDHPYLPFLMIALIGLITIINPSYGLAAVVLSVPVQESMVVPFVRNELTFTQITLFGLVLGFAVTFYRYRIWLDSVVLGFIVVAAAFSVSLVQMDSPGLWFGEVYRWAAAAAVYVIARSVLTSWQSIRPLLWAVVAGLGMVSSVALWQFLAESGPDSFLVGGALRVYGTFGTPNTLAAYIEFSATLLIGLAMFGFRNAFRQRIGVQLWIAMLAVSGIGFLVLVLTQSRGGAVGMLAALGVIALLIPKRLLIPGVIAGAFAVGLFMLTPAGEAQFERFSRGFGEPEPGTTIEHGDALGRGSLWATAIRMIEDEPLTGIGAGEYDYHYRQYVPEWIDRFPRGQAHNAWLQMGAQAGLPGIVAFSTWLLASFVSVAGAARRASEPLGRLLAWGAMAVLVAFSLHSLVDYLNVLSLGIQISAVTAIGLALAPDPLRSVQRTPAFARSEIRAGATA